MDATAYTMILGTSSIELCITFLTSIVHVHTFILHYCFSIEYDAAFIIHPYTSIMTCATFKNAFVHGGHSIISCKLHKCEMRNIHSAKMQCYHGYQVV